MKKIMIIFLLLISNFASSEYYTIVGTDNIMGTTLTLAEGEKFKFIRGLKYNGGDWGGENLYCLLTYEGGLTKTILVHDNNDEHIIYGPCTISLNTSQNNSTRVITYTIENLNSSDDSSTSDSKYTVSLNNDGTRLAIGEKNGTNSTARVYEYDDVAEAWEQLGDNVE